MDRRPSNMDRCESIISLLVLHLYFRQHEQQHELVLSQSLSHLKVFICLHLNDCQFWFYLFSVY